MTGAHVRIDNRLIHGQVTVAWTRRLGVRRLVVCNDDVAADELQCMLLPQAARGLPTDVLSVVATLAAEPGADAMIIAKHPEDVFRLVEGGLRPEIVNVGNVAPRPGEKSSMVTRSVAVTADEADAYRKLAAAGVPLVTQLLPQDKPADFVSLLDRKGL
ncbi:PTS system mannose/fructose/N-acetylgalactosamine-transporter subunit IIB [Amycolatopsis vancoresmycina]|uniref:PTS system mannose-specific transporter subunit IIB n=1 Tax=Amycolatopsis vancoresmycina DSM 44592 TaxID=1292037 RepID=R1HUL9_9PSEU|nr:PTS sugar transporter subunit IIB [Amycolatopsis vancoresmycina]EOD67265.1 PTS system mannose-specific transporter subunit IIB [Amycolatopsis vancoresmycina DSM 44592]